MNLKAELGVSALLRKTSMIEEMIEEIDAKLSKAAADGSRVDAPR